MTQATTDSKELARGLSEALRGWLSGAEMTEVAARNATAAYAGCCASHDFCDANMAMSEAFAKAFGRDPGFDQHDVDLMNSAWEAAKAAGFDASKIA